MPVFFKCKNCGQEHPSPLYFLNADVFAASVIGVNHFSCPVTLKTAPYEKKHLFWLKGDAEDRSKRPQPGHSLLTNLRKPLLRSV